jgi:hypothetical protein
VTAPEIWCRANSCGGEPPYTSDYRRLSTQPAFSGAIVPAHSLNEVPEYGLGITPWFELRAYLPLYTLTRDGRFLIDGTKLRALFVSPNAAERTSGMGQFRAEL